MLHWSSGHPFIHRTYYKKTSGAACSAGRWLSLTLPASRSERGAQGQGIAPVIHVPRRDALDDAMRRYRELREAFPDKPIVVGEIGWPSAGRVPPLTAALVRIRRGAHAGIVRSSGYHVQQSLHVERWHRSEGRARRFAGRQRAAPASRHRHPVPCSRRLTSLALQLLLQALRRVRYGGGVSALRSYATY